MIHSTTVFALLGKVVLPREQQERTGGLAAVEDRWPLHVLEQAVSSISPVACCIFLLHLSLKILLKPTIQVDELPHRPQHKTMPENADLFHW